MKKNLLFLSVLSLIIFLVNGCWGDSPNVRKHHVFKSYITKYSNSKDIELDLSGRGNIVILYKELSGSCDFKSKGADKARYDSLCKANNDLSYNKKRDYMAFPTWGVTSAMHITNIEVVSDKDFDATHPAGNSLKDIVRLVSNSPKKFIDSGYKETFDWDSYDIPESFKKEPAARIHSYDYRSTDRENYFPVDIKLSDFTANDGRMLGNQHIFLGFLLFDVEPITNKEHTFTVTISLTDGRVFSKTITKTFE